MSSIKEQLAEEVKRTFSAQWTVAKTESIPSPENLLLNSNDAKELEATVLYADLDGSTNMVDNYDWTFSAEIYKNYLRCASQILRHGGGTITAYDGDRVMAIFTGPRKNTEAVRCALKINSAVHDIIRPAVAVQYPGKNFTVKHSVGVDTSTLRAARIGVHGDNDIVWVGRAANYAAKLTAIGGPNGPLWITADVYNMMTDEVKLSSGNNMWTQYRWKTMSDIPVYGSNFLWRTY